VLFLLNRLTVGICAYNEGRNISKLLENVLDDQELSEDSEVIVVCSGCVDNTVKQVQVCAAKDPRVKLHVEVERSGKASAINYIFSHAAGDIIIFVSADTLPFKASFPKLLSKLESPNVGIVSGNPVPVNSKSSLTGRVVHLMWRFHGYVFAELNDAGLARHATEVFCIRKGIVKRIPAETVNDDAYIAVVSKKKGWLIKYSAESKLSICGPKTYREYFQQRHRVIFGHYQLRKLTGESPQYLVHLMPLHPVRTVKLALWLTANYDPVTLATFLLTEFIVNVAAMFDILSGNAHDQWTMLPSTKTVIP